MKYLNLIYKSGMTYSLVLNSSEDGKQLFNGIIKGREEKVNTYLIYSRNGYMFIDPMEVMHCEISDKKFEK